MKAIRADLADYTAALGVSDQKVVHSAFVRLPSLLFELGLSPQPTQVFAIKIEVDTNPPAGAVLATTTVQRHLVLHLHHHDQASLLAGKLYAVLQRSYPKGRDFFDLFWYLSDPSWPSPNLALLNNALAQTGWSGVALTEQNWREIFEARLIGLDWKQLVADTRPFLEGHVDIAEFSRERLIALLHRGKTGP